MLVDAIVCPLMARVQGGDLFTRLTKAQHRKFTENEARGIMRQVCCHD